MSKDILDMTSEEMDMMVLNDLDDLSSSEDEERDIHCGDREINAEETTCSTQALTSLIDIIQHTQYSILNRVHESIQKCQALSLSSKLNNEKVTARIVNDDIHKDITPSETTMPLDVESIIISEEHDSVLQQCERELLDNEDKVRRELAISKEEETERETSRRIMREESASKREEEMSVNMKKIQEAERHIELLAREAEEMLTIQERERVQRELAEALRIKEQVRQGPHNVTYH